MIKAAFVAIGLFILSYGLTFLVTIMVMSALAGCSHTPYREFNREDTQDGACYAKYGGLRGFCDAIEEENGVIDAFDNNCLYETED